MKTNTRKEWLTILLAPEGAAGGGGTATVSAPAKTGGAGAAAGGSGAASSDAGTGGDVGAAGGTVDAGKGKQMQPGVRRGVTEKPQPSAAETARIAEEQRILQEEMAASRKRMAAERGENAGEGQDGAGEGQGDDDAALQVDAAKKAKDSVKAVQDSAAQAGSHDRPIPEVCEFLEEHKLGGYIGQADPILLHKMAIDLQKQELQVQEKGKTHEQRQRELDAYEAKLAEAYQHLLKVKTNKKETDWKGEGQQPWHQYTNAGLPREAFNTDAEYGLYKVIEKMGDDLTEAFGGQRGMVEKLQQTYGAQLEAQAKELSQLKRALGILHTERQGSMRGEMMKTLEQVYDKLEPEFGDVLMDPKTSAKIMKRAQKLLAPEHDGSYDEDYYDADGNPDFEKVFRQACYMVSGDKMHSVARDEVTTTLKNNARNASARRADGRSVPPVKTMTEEQILEEEKAKLRAGKFRDADTL